MVLNVLSLSPSTLGSSTTFTAGMIWFKVANKGSNTCYFNLNSAASSTTSYPLSAEEYIEIGVPATSIHTITASGSTKVNVIEYY